MHNQSHGCNIFSWLARHVRAALLTCHDMAFLQAGLISLIMGPLLSLFFRAMALRSTASAACSIQLAQGSVMLTATCQRPPASACMPFGEMISQSKYAPQLSGWSIGAAPQALPALQAILRRARSRCDGAAAATWHSTLFDFN